MSEKAKYKPVVLHVEDEDASAYLFRLVLREARADVEVFRLCDGEDGILFLTRTGIFADAPRPDVVVVDLNMPRKNGHDFVAEIRQRAELQDLPLIMFSSSVRREDQDRALTLGANHYMEKSIDLDGFVAVARQVLAYISPEAHSDLPPGGSPVA